MHSKPVKTRSHVLPFGLLSRTQYQLKFCLGLSLWGLMHLWAGVYQVWVCKKMVATKFGEIRAVSRLCILFM